MGTGVDRGVAPSLPLPLAPASPSSALGARLPLPSFSPRARAGSSVAVWLVSRVVCVSRSTRVSARDSLGPAGAVRFGSFRSRGAPPLHAWRAACRVCAARSASQGAPKPAGAGAQRPGVVKVLFGLERVARRRRSASGAVLERPWAAIARLCRSTREKCAHTRGRGGAGCVVVRRLVPGWLLPFLSFVPRVHSFPPSLYLSLGVPPPSA